MIPSPHIVFDWNGTLLDDVAFANSCVNLVRKAHGLRCISIDDYRRSFCFPIRDFYASLGFDFSKVSFEQLMSEYLAAFESGVQECSLHHGAIELLERLRDRGFELSLLSATFEPHLQLAVDHFGIRSYFSHIVGSGNIHAAGKENMALSLQANLKLRPEDVSLVGDTTHDTEIAERIGWRPILVTHGHQSAHGVGSPTLVQNLADLQDMLVGSSG